MIVRYFKFYYLVVWVFF